MKISKKATTIAIVNQKGGTGKTTTCDLKRAPCSIGQDKGRT